MHQYSGISLRILQVMLRAQGFWWQLKRRADFQIPSKPGCSQKLLLECLSNCMHPCILFISVFFFFSNQNGSFCKNIMEMDHSSFFFFLTGVKADVYKSVSSWKFSKTAPGQKRKTICLHRDCVLRCSSPPHYSDTKAVTLRRYS